MKGKHFAKANWSRTRIVSAILSVALLFGCITFTTAWLIAEDENGGPVVNEFTGSMLQISLTPDSTQGPYKLVPGVTYELSEEEDPEITVAAGSVECYLFVVFHEVGTKVNGNPMDLDHYVSCDVGSDFKMLSFDSNNYWRTGTDPGTGVPFKDYVFYYGGEDTQNYVLSPEVPQAQTFDVLQKTNNGKQYFKINETVTKLEAHPNAISVNPYVTFTGYSIQTLGLKPNDGNIDDVRYAWSLVAEAIEDGNTKAVVLN